ncbi:hypothetical protein [Agitococcus lubricus]|uniref:Uncharacterized protein n=1 Tax=Agitococcus lubricus TaxID=1077255 RepID=A0A2T5IYB0_9GAMM|nr:hypothetical protein [Agitococcus lubricus]PTQ88937.1 hypothetical protein C8N29_11086 [Agitococcus lubricus]
MSQFIHYKHQQLSSEQIVAYAQQYQDEDMWQLTGQDENYFPFLIGQSLTDFRIVYWSKRHGIMDYADDDPVRYYAFAYWLAENMHPVFASQAEAEQHALAREWPRVE